MDHTDIAKQALVERYYRGLLPAEDEIAFEEHFMSCPECQAQLELHRGLERGLKAMVAEDAVRVAVGTGLLAWLARRSGWVQVGVVSLALLAAVGIPTLWLGAGNRQLRTEVAEARATAAGLEARAETAEKNKAELETRLAELAEAATRRAVSSLGKLPVFLLRTLRGEPGEVGTIVPAGAPFALAVDPGADARFASYRARVVDETGREVFAQADLGLNELEVLLLSFPGDFFAPGGYRLEIEGVPARGAATSLGGYPFRIVAGS